MSQEADEHTQLLRGRLRARLGERRCREVFDAILAHLEAYGAGGEDGTSPGARSGPGAEAPRIPEAAPDEETRRLLADLLDHVLRQATGAVR